MTLGTPRQLDARTLIELAESTSRLSLAQWSLALLQEAYPGTALETFLALPVSSRDRLALAVRSRFLSPELRSEPICGDCEATFELTLDPAALGFAHDAAWADPAVRSVRIGDRQLGLRPVCLGDLLAVESVPDQDQAAEMLAQRVSGESMLPAARAALDAVLASLDPSADIWLETSCPECGVSQTIAFEPVHFLAHELRQLAQQILADVVVIARVFHWSEVDILALPHHRRAYYVAEALS
jgi:hypothetical protein